MFSEVLSFDSANAESEVTMCYHLSELGLESSNGFPGWRSPGSYVAGKVLPLLG
jgi:hypothetical protein